MNLERAVERLNLECSFGDIDGTLGAALDVIGLIAGIPGCSARVREIMEPFGA
ncbi:hypothetical protein [Streptomyces sp. NPDC055990]|uniref:hypothetical protein n=1 Tax=Streptomyces sp. NPDC055990 TaxID=3345672 RepID=UPI0035D54AF6